MSVTLTISEKTYEKLKSIASSKGFEDVGKFLDEWEEIEAANRREVVGDIRAFRKKMEEKYGEMPDSTELIREDRMR